MALVSVLVCSANIMRALEKHFEYVKGFSVLVETNELWARILRAQFDGWAWHFELHLIFIGSLVLCV